MSAFSSSVQSPHHHHHHHHNTPHLVVVNTPTPPLTTISNINHNNNNNNNNNPHDELTRQSVILEFIHGEVEYIQDLNQYEKLFLIPIQDQSPPSIFQPAYLQKFIKLVFSSILDIRDHNQHFLNQLQHRQSQAQLNPLLTYIGDLVLSAALQWGPLYVAYAKDHPLGEYEIDQQTSQNPLFADLIQNIPRQNSAKNDFRHYYSRATLRLARYLLLLTRLLQVTPERHPDHNCLSLAIDIIKNQCRECDSAIGAQHEKLLLLKLKNSIVNKIDMPPLHLQSPNRKIYAKGKLMMKRREGTTTTTGLAEVYVILLDHYLLVTKPKKDEQSCTRYHLSGDQAVRLEFMKLDSFDLPPEKRPRTLRTITDTLLGTNSNSSSPLSPNKSHRDSDISTHPPFDHHSVHATTPSPTHQILSNQQESPSSTSSTFSYSSPPPRNMIFPLTIQSFGNHPGTITLFADSERTRLLWKKRLEKAIEIRLKTLKSLQAFELEPIITLNMFFSPGHNNNPETILPVKETGRFSVDELNQLFNYQVPSELLPPHPPHSGAPTCSAPFISSDGTKQLFAIGGPEGLWLGNSSDPSSFRQVLRLKNLTQCHVLQAYGLLLLLADKVILSYSLETLLELACLSSFKQGQAPTRESCSSGRSGGSKAPRYDPGGKTKPQRPKQPYVKYLNEKRSSTSSSEGFRSLEMHKSRCHSSHSSIDTNESFGSVILAKRSNSPDEIRHPVASQAIPARPKRFSCPPQRQLGPMLSSSNVRSRSNGLSLSTPIEEAFTINNSPRNHNRQQDKGPVKISRGSGKDVSFFRLGNVGSKTVLIYAQTSLAGNCGHEDQTNLIVMEYRSDDQCLVEESAEDDFHHQAVSSRTGSFKEVQELKLPHIVHDVQFHESTREVMVLFQYSCAVLNLDHLYSYDTIPHLPVASLTAEHHRPSAVGGLTKRIEGSKLLKVFAVSRAEYLFCYNKFAYFANKRGEPILSRTRPQVLLEWDGRPHTIVLSARHVIAYSDTLIEFWDLRTCERVQIIYGKSIRCLFNGTSSHLISQSSSTSSASAVSPGAYSSLSSPSGLVAERGRVSRQSSSASSDSGYGSSVISGRRKSVVTSLSTTTSTTKAVTTTTTTTTMSEQVEVAHVSMRDDLGVYRVFGMTLTLGS